MFSWKSAALSVSNNCQSKISRIAHKSNERRTITSIAYPTGNRSQAPIAIDVCIKSVWRTPPRSRFASRARLLQLPPRDPLDFDLAFVPAGLREIVGHLQPQPSFRATAERLVEADRHFWRNTALAVYKVIEGLPRDPQNVRGLGHCQIESFDAVVPDRGPRLARVPAPQGFASRCRGTPLR